MMMTMMMMVLTMMMHGQVPPGAAVCDGLPFSEHAVEPLHAVRPHVHPGSRRRR